MKNNSEFKFCPTSESRSNEPAEQLKRDLDVPEMEINQAKGEKKTLIPCFDDTIPQDVPKYKQSWTTGWRVKIRKTVTNISLNELSPLKAMVSMIRASRKLSNVEVHLLWFSYIPQNLFRENMSISLHFTESTDPDRSMLAKNIAPAYLFTHHIFYPGHAIELYGSPIPWRVTVDLSEVGISNNYVCGELWIKVVGSQSCAVAMEEERLSSMTALVPLTQPISGVTMTVPRVASKNMVMGYVRRGVNSKKRTEKILKLQALGVDIEALVLTGKLHSVLLSVPDNLLEHPRDGSNFNKIMSTITHSIRKK